MSNRRLASQRWWKKGSLKATRVEGNGLWPWPCRGCTASGLGTGTSAAQHQETKPIANCDSLHCKWFHIRFPSSSSVITTTTTTPQESLTFIVVRVGMLPQCLLYALHLLGHSWEHPLLQAVKLIKAAPCAHLAKPHKDTSHCLEWKEPKKLKPFVMDWLVSLPKVIFQCPNSNITIFGQSPYRR